MLGVHSQSPHVFILWQDSDHVVTTLSPTSGYKTMYLCHLDFYTVTYVSAHVVTAHYHSYEVVWADNVFKIFRSQCKKDAKRE